MQEKAIQDFYHEPYNHCYGCGTLNEHGLKIKTHWDGRTGSCVFRPREHHIAFPGFVYGGLIASVIDCHSTGTAVAAVYDREGRAPGSEPALRFVTASLHVDYLKPTPIGKDLVLRSRIKDMTERRVVVATELFVEELLCVRGELVAAKIPETMHKR